VLCVYLLRRNITEKERCGAVGAAIYQTILKWHWRAEGRAFGIGRGIGGVPVAGSSASGSEFLPRKLNEGSIWVEIHSSAPGSRRPQK
jgi:hypothetical protein